MLASSCALQPVQVGSKKLDIDPANYGYELGHSAQNALLSINEYVMTGDSILDWESLLTENHTVTYITPKAMAERIANGIRKDCPNSKMDMRSLGGGTYTLEFSHDGCSGWEGHHSFRKIIKGDSGLYIISFDMKNRVFDAKVYQEWKKRILAVELVSR